MIIDWGQDGPWRKMGKVREVRRIGWTRRQPFPQELVILDTDTGEYTALKLVKGRPYVGTDGEPASFTGTFGGPVTVLFEDGGVLPEETEPDEPGQ